MRGTTTIAAMEAELVGKAVARVMDRLLGRARETEDFAHIAHGAPVDDIRTVEVKLVGSGVNQPRLVRRNPRGRGRP